MNKMLESRKNNAIRIAKEINNYLNQGYLVFNEDNEIVARNFEITEEGVLLPISDKSKIIYCSFDENLDNGLYTPIKEYNTQFKKWKIVHPKYIKTLKI